MYLWMVIVGVFFMLGMAWGIGANDVANFFGTPVGAKSITLKKAMIIAFIFEFIGAFALGSEVTNTIRKKIVDFDVYNGSADILMLGMFCALISASLWVYLATKYSLPVSTTQSIVGAIIGFVLVSRGPGAVHWNEVRDIVIYWIMTPLFGCCGCLIFYIPFRYFVLRRDNSYKLSIILYPLFWFIVIFIMITFLLFKGFKRITELGDWVDTNPGLVVLVGLAAGVVAAILAYIILIKCGIVTRYAEKKIESDDNIDTDIELKKPIKVKVNSTSDIDTDTEKEKEDNNNNNENKLIKISSSLKTGLEYDVHANLTEKERDLEKYSTKFDNRTEKLFEWLQVLAATFGIFAHGSNDIANAVAPFSAILSLSSQSPDDDILSKSDVAIWVSLLGSIAMSVGCVTYGYNVIKTLGVKLVKISPSRGYFTQVSAAIVIIFASNYGFPASTTHAQVGATIAIGLVEKLYNKKLQWNKVFNWKLLLQVFFGWIATIIISGTTSAALFAVLAYSPCN